MATFANGLFVLVEVGAWSGSEVAFLGSEPLSLAEGGGWLDGRDAVWLVVAGGRVEDQLLVESLGFTGKRHFSIPLLAHSRHVHQAVVDNPQEHQHHHQVCPHPPQFLPLPLVRGCLNRFLHFTGLRYWACLPLQPTCPFHFPIFLFLAALPEGLKVGVLTDEGVELGLLLS